MTAAPDNSPADSTPTWHIGVGMACVAGAVMMLQIALTRVFSLLIWYHFAFLAIAIALLGFTGGGIMSARLLARAPGVAPTDIVGRALALGSFLFAAGAVVALQIAAHLPLGPSPVASPGQFALFVLVIVAFLVPFACAGTVLSLALSRYTRHASALYFADLLGSGLGCAAAVPILDSLGGGAGAVVASALTASLGGVTFALAMPAGGRAMRIGGATAVVVCAALIGLARNPLGWFYLPNAKIFPRIPRSAILARACTSLSCVDFFRNPNHFGMWGQARTYPGPLPEQIGVVIDAWAITSILRAHPEQSGRGRYTQLVFEALPANMTHLLNRTVGRTTDHMLIIGAGGGVDIASALYFGVHRVEAAEINPVIVDGVARRYADFAGNLYQDPSVQVHVAEGRNYLRRSTERYDIIQVSGVDTYAATQAGAFALSENYLYTVEAMREFLDHLAPDGTLTMTRWMYVPERQTIRLCVVIEQAMRAMGIGDAAQRVVVIGAPLGAGDGQYSVLLVRREPFSTQDLTVLRLLARRRAFRLVYMPDGSGENNVFRGFFGATDRAAFVRAYPFRIDATTDDQPFFFEHNRLSRLLSNRDVIFGAANGQTVLVASLLTVALLGALLWFVSARRSRAPGVVFSWRAQSYFVAVGLGFITLETAAIPRMVLFLGHPVYALTVVLFALLIASGLGSALSQRTVGEHPRRLVAIAMAVAATALALPWVTQRLLGTSAWPFAARVAAVSATLAIPGVLMGMMFPSGLRLLVPRGRPTLVAHAWVLNGVASVIGTVTAMMLSIELGFTATMQIGAAMYLAAGGAAALAARASRT